MPVALSLGGLFQLNFLEALKKLLAFKWLILQASLSSLLLGLGVGLLTLIFLTCSLASFSWKRSRRFMAAYTHAGSSLVAFAFLIIFLENFLWVKWILGLSLLFFPFIYRFFGEPLLEKLQQQIQVAQICGAKDSQIFQDILWPQCRGSLLLASGIAGFFATGEFAYSSLVSFGEKKPRFDCI